MHAVSWVCLIGFILSLSILMVSGQGVLEKPVSIAELNQLHDHTRIVLVGRVQSTYVQGTFITLSLSDGKNKISVFFRKAHLLQNVQKNQLVRVHGLSVRSSNQPMAVEADRIEPV